MREQCYVQPVTTTTPLRELCLAERYDNEMYPIRLAF